MFFARCISSKKKKKSPNIPPPKKKKNQQASFDHTLVVYKKNGYKTLLEQVYMTEPQTYLSSDFVSNYIISNNNTVGTDLPGNDSPIVTA